MKEIFEASSIAVIGASPNADRPGYTLISSLLQYGYEGKIFPVNPKYKEILGLPSCSSLSDIQFEIDLVFFAVAGPAIPPMIEECGRKKVKAIVIISAGFSEASDSGAKLEREIVSRCRNAGIHLLGPNTTGFVSYPSKLVASINHFDQWIGGNLAIGGQTGIFAGAYMDEVMSRSSQLLGYDFSISLGNMADYDEVDFLQYVRDRPNVKAIQLYLESIKRPVEFFATTTKLAREGKPTILLRGGRTEMGRKSTLAHTGSSGQDPKLDEEFLLSRGVIPVTDIEEFFDIAKAFSYQPLPRGNRIGVVTMSGANGTLAADAAEDFGLEFPEFSDETMLYLKKAVPPEQVLRNPADVGFALTSGKVVRKNSMQAVVNDSAVDSMLVIDLAVANSDFREVRSTFEELHTGGKPVFLVLQGGNVKRRWLDELEGLKVPIYPTPRRALRAIQAMWQFQNHH